MVIGRSATTCEALDLIPGAALIVLVVGLRVGVQSRGSNMRAATVDSTKNWAAAGCGLRAGRYQ